MKRVNFERNCLLVAFSFSMISCSNSKESDWVAPFFSLHRNAFDEIKGFVASCPGFEYANGIGEYKDQPPPFCKNGADPKAVSSRLKRLGVYWAVGDPLRSSGIQLVIKNPVVFGSYGGIYYDAVAKRGVDIVAQGGTPLEKTCPCHWYYQPY